MRGGRTRTVRESGEEVTKWDLRKKLEETAKRRRRRRLCNLIGDAAASHGALALPSRAQCKSGVGRVLQANYRANEVQYRLRLRLAEERNAMQGETERDHAHARPDKTCGASAGFMTWTRLGVGARAISPSVLRPSAVRVRNASIRRPDGP